LLHHQYNPKESNNDTRAPHTPAPTITPTFFFSLITPHLDPRGLPHSPLFPSKPSLLNPLKEAGTFPLSLLLATETFLSLFKLPNSVGIGPESSLSDNTNSFKYEQLENEGGIAPESLLLDKSTATKNGIQVQISVGISEDKELEARFNLRTLPQYFKDSGIRPESFKL